MPRLWISSASRRPSLSGMPISISRSKRPGRRKAGSREFGNIRGGDDDHLPARFEAVHQGIEAERRRDVRPGARRPSRSRFGAIASISSMKMMAGAFCFRLLEHLAQMRFARAVELVDDFRAVDVDEMHVGLRARRPARSTSCRCPAGRRAERPSARRCRDGRTPPGI